ncbi:acid phosphatase 1 [Amborella trichopoda]|uniref:Acid phosphatase n=1 Tax=Amborella trichopoda TaxID=13333 RepID=W1P9B1_AMBTC|nr:acid phosphatase 1 [Amborella trichopoda]ERN04259.1 hypothetical protein AMTR_s00077p00160000 [Amborella trichopoda]|eukprot:XP_006842584.3 acid phosphatase 1 [Amborella trichopoda]
MLQSVRALWEVLLVTLVAFSRALGAKPAPRSVSDNSGCLSWRVAVEANNVRAFRTVPDQCLAHVESYMSEGQYERDLEMVVEQIVWYSLGIVLGSDGLDAFVLDVDDTCISNRAYYRHKRFGGEPYDPVSFKKWALRGCCPAVPAILGLYKHLTHRGFKVFLLTGRDQELLDQATRENLNNQGFIGYERLILRGPEYRGQSAVAFKSAIRKRLAEEGYRIWGNIGDQWSDLLGDNHGDRTFKLPNPMYFVP